MMHVYHTHTKLQYDKKCDKLFLTHESSCFDSLMRESLKMQFKMYLTFVPSLDKIKIVLVEYAEQIDAHNINIYVLVSIHIYTLLYIRDKYKSYGENYILR